MLQIPLKSQNANFQYRLYIVCDIHTKSWQYVYKVQF